MGKRAQKHDFMAVVLILVTFALTLAGLVAVYSTTAMTAATEDRIIPDALRNQFFFAIVGFAVGYVIYRAIPVRIWAGKITWALWALAVLLLIVTAVYGTEVLGAKRWLEIGSFRFQPSEFMKVAFVIMAAKIVEEHRTGAITRLGMWVSLGARVGLPIVAMLLAQSDLGTTMVCLVGVIAVLWLGGVPGRDVAIFCAGCIALGTLAIVTSPYRLQRFLTTFDPWADGQGGLGSGYQLIHSLYALSSGGAWGVGIGGSFEKYGSLPEAETDFIFAVVGEECGLFGTIVIIALFIGFLWAGLRISNQAVTTFGATFAGALSVTLVFQAFLNIASVIGVWPMTGKPLPFMSYGGSSLIMSLVMVGMIASVTREESPSEREARRRRDELIVVRPIRGRDKQGGNAVVEHLDRHGRGSDSRLSGASRNSDFASRDKGGGRNGQRRRR